MAADTIPSRLFDRAKRQPDRPAYFVRTRGVWRATSWESYANEVRRVAKALIALGFERGQTVCILGANRPEWVTLDLACMAAGGAPAGIYTTCSPEEVGYIIDHAEAPLVLVENEAQWEKVQAERPKLTRLRHVVTMEGAPRLADTMSWEQLLAKGDEVSDGVLRERVESLEPGNVATLIYTSGTTGPPKGVMLSHRNLTFTADLAHLMINVGEGERSLSYLPLSHIAEQVFTLHLPITIGGQVYFAESIERVADNLKEVQPTVFFGVPRIWEKFHAGIAGRLAETSGVKKQLVDWAMGVGTKVTTLRSRGDQPERTLALQYALARKLVFDKIKGAIGLAEAKVCISGAAPIAREVLEFFGGLDIVVLEIYGQSEDTGPTSFNLPDSFRLGTVGRPVPGVEVKIGDDGEILVRGPNVFLGYHKDEAATRETLVDGWLCSGDLGQFDAEGFLSITGRKKDIIITAGGKNIAPQEHRGRASRTTRSWSRGGGYRRPAQVPHGARHARLRRDRRWAGEHGVPVAEAHRDRAILGELQKLIDDVNSHVARVEQIKKFEVLGRPFTIENGELTPTLKIKRSVVYDHFADTIETMYRE